MGHFRCGEGWSIRKLASDFHIWSELNKITPLDSVITWQKVKSLDLLLTPRFTLHLLTACYIWTQSRDEFVSLLDPLLTHRASQYSLFHWVRERFPWPLALSHVRTDCMQYHGIGCSPTPDPVPTTESVGLHRVSGSHRHNRNPLSRGTGQT